jgi:hypothetical protein|tara:strand:+ start:27459 stop:27902 length:444 start_codon:yes stop_codon:yes gene_type:complete
MLTPEQIAAQAVRNHYPESVAGWLGGPDNPMGRLDHALFYDRITSGDILAMLAAAVESDRAQLREAIRSDRPIPGLRPYRLATVDELLNAWDQFDSYSGDVSEFVDAWNNYTAGLDFACPDSPDGLHAVTGGSCDNCGDKNREAYTL